MKAAHQFVYQQLHDVLGINTFPIIATVDTNYPFAVYRRSDMTPDGTKDLNVVDTCVFEIKIVSDKYEATLDIAENVITHFRNLKALIDNYIFTSRNIGSSEDFQTDVYIQTVQIEVKTLLR